MSKRNQAERDLESIIDATQHSGYTLITKEWQNMLAYLVNSAPDHCDTADKWFQRRGEIAMMRKVLSAEHDARGALADLPNQRFDDEPALPEKNDLED
jgi:galactokinase